MTTRHFDDCKLILNQVFFWAFYKFLIIILFNKIYKISKKIVQFSHFFIHAFLDSLSEWFSRIMSQIKQILQLLTDYQSAIHHQHPDTLIILTAIQDWQAQRMYRTHRALFAQADITPLADFFIEQVYHHRSFDILANQLIIACQNALSGVGKLEQLVPSRIMQAGLLSLQASLDAIMLDLQLAKLYQQNGGTPSTVVQLDADTMIRLYRQSDAQYARIQQIQNIQIVCTQSYHYFNSFILHQAFKLAKNRAYQNGYQPLYDFIFAGLHAIRTIKRIDDFIQPFIQKELQIVKAVHDLQISDDDLKRLFL